MNKREQATLRLRGVLGDCLLVASVVRTLVGTILVLLRTGRAKSLVDLSTTPRAQHDL